MNISIEMDISALSRSITELPERMRVRFMRASRETAEALEREMRGRLQRQLSAQSTGATVEGITHRVAQDGNGYVVVAESKRHRAMPMPNLPKLQASALNLPLWLEKGTKPGKRKNYARTQPRPFFYASVELEAPGHERRIIDAWNELANEVNS